MKKFINKHVERMWNITGSFGKICGYTEVVDNEYGFSNAVCTVKGSYVKDKNGVICRNDKFINTSCEDIYITNLKMSFMFDGGEYEVYTQYNGWCNESLGEWQPLVSGVTVKTNSLRACKDATPFICLWNKQTQRGLAFHMICDGAWEMNVRRIHNCGANTNIIFEAGACDDNLYRKVKAGETVDFPKLIFYQFTNKIDMDCYKLHSYFNNKYPRRSMPVIYNSWFYRFDKITYENIMEQVERASELGMEYFVIDAGWFGDGNGWYESVGDWSENCVSALKGRMSDIAENVRKRNMKFGLWFEIERANKNAKSVAEHPEYYIASGDERFVDFSNPDAVKYILDVLFANIDKYGIEFIKFDFNADLEFDETQTAFNEYFRGYALFLKAIKEKYPDIYLENCASGGMRMNLKNAIDFDSFWFSDNQSPYEGMRIFKDSIKRLPPQVIEKWAVIRSMQKFVPVYDVEYADKIISTNNAQLTDVVEVDENFLKGFMCGGPMGLTCDVTDFSEGHTQMLKDFISEYKKDREFWRNAVCRILTDTETMLVLQYSDEQLEESRIIVFANICRQNNICVYPAVVADAVYSVNGEYEVSDIVENGINIELDAKYKSQSITIKKVK